MLRALPNLKKLDNVEVSPEEVREALKGDFLQQKQQQQQQPEYSDDFESQYRQQAATSGFRGHSPIREVNCRSKNDFNYCGILKMTKNNFTMR